ncbi:MAG: hypothetical protein ABR913_01865 [Sedimentisphaerales bacterium]|jgi:hypothetical protein
MRKFILFLLFVVSPVLGNAKADTNLALHKTYTLRPNPNYPLCTDELDSNQLTDGEKYGSAWGNKSTVGWQYGENPPEITIDLEKICALDEVRIYTIGGGRAGVHYPDSIIVMASSDNRNYKLAGFADLRDKLKKSLKSEDKEPLTVSIKTTNAYGRYVKVVIQSSTTFVFIDEIEVFGRSSKETAGRQMGDTALTIKDSLMLVDNLLELKQSITSAKESISRLNIDPNAKLLLIGKLQKAANDVSECEQQELSRASFATQKAAIAKIKAEIYKAYYKSDFIVSAANPMKPLLSSDTILEPAKTSIELSAWQGEYESAAVNIINCSENKISARAAIEAVKLNGTVASEAEKCFTLRRAVYVKAKQVGGTADALVLQGNNEFTIEPGETSQLWFTYFNPTLKAGKYNSNLAITAMTNDGNSLPTQNININLTVEPIVFDQNIALNTYNWAYPTICSVTEKYLSETAFDLQSHRTNVMVIPSNLLSFSKHGSDGFPELNNYFNNFGFARTYLFFLAFNNTSVRDMFGSFMSIEWQTNFTQWLKNLTAYLKNRGIDYAGFAIYPYDETLGDDFLKVAKLIKAIDPKIRIFANNMGSGTAELNSFKNLIDIWCPAVETCQEHPDWLKYLQKFGKPIWTYSGLAPAKAISPSEFYRMLPWLAFKRKQAGAGFWVYTDQGQTNPWDELMKPMGYYGVIYSSTGSPVPTSGENIIPSRRWEAWREGVEDYQYLYEAQVRINRLKTSDTKRASEMQKTLDNQINNVLSNPQDTARVYCARATITAMLR